MKSIDKKIVLSNILHEIKDVSIQHLLRDVMHWIKWDEIDLKNIVLHHRPEMALDKKFMDL